MKGKKKKVTNEDRLVSIGERASNAKSFDNKEDYVIRIDSARAS